MEKQGGPGDSSAEAESMWVLEVSPQAAEEKGTFCMQITNVDVQFYRKKTITFCTQICTVNSQFWAAEVCIRQLCRPNST